MRITEFINEGWSQKYKSSINCSHPKGFSQKAHCAGKKHNESIDTPIMEMVCENCGMCETHGNLNEIKKGQKDSNGFTKCWPGKHAEGTKKGKNGGQVRNCEPNESISESKERCKQCGMTNCSCKPGTCKCKPIEGWVPNKGFRKAVAEGSEPDAYGRTGKKHECGSCDGTGIDTHDDECPECGGKGWVRDKQDVAEGLNEQTFTGEYDSEDMQDARDQAEFQAKHLLGQSIHGDNWDGNVFSLPLDDYDGQHERTTSDGKGKFIAKYKYTKKVPPNVIPKVQEQGVAEGLPQILRKVVPGYARREIDMKMGAEKFGKTDVDRDANFQRYKKIQDKLKEQGVAEDWNKVNKKDKTSGMSQKAVNAYRRENPGSKLKTAVTTKPSKLKKGSKAANRRKSFCARMGGNKGPMKKPNGKPTPKALALRRWNCESIEELQELVMLAEQFVNKKKNESI